MNYIHRSHTMLLRAPEADQASAGSDDPNKNREGGTDADLDPTAGADAPDPNPDGDGETTDTTSSAEILKIKARNAELEKQLEAERAKKDKAVAESKDRKAKLQSVRDTYGDAEGTIEELRQDNATLEERVASLTKERNDLLAEVETVREQRQARRLELLAKIPEEDRADYEDMSVERLEKFIARYHTNTQTRTTNAEVPTSQKGAAEPGSIAEAIEAEYRRRGIDVG